MKRIDKILEEVLKKAEPLKEDSKNIEIFLKEFLKKFKKKIKNSRLDAKIYIGGSFAKKTMINKKMYDIDIFVRFNKKYKNISQLTGKLLLGFNKKLIQISTDEVFGSLKRLFQNKSKSKDYFRSSSYNKNKKTRRSRKHY